MTLAVWFWVLMIISLVFGIWTGYVPGQPYTYRHWGGNALMFVLLVIIGLAVFGSPVK